MVAPALGAVKRKLGRLFDQDKVSFEDLVHDPDQLVTLNVLQTVQVPVRLPRQPCDLLLLCRHGRASKSFPPLHGVWRGRHTLFIGRSRKTFIYLTTGTAETMPTLTSTHLSVIVIM
jgi:hypothetical protein